MAMSEPPINSLQQLAREVEELRAIVDDQIASLEKVRVFTQNTRSEISSLKLRVGIHALNDRGLLGRLKWLVLGR